MTLRARLAVLTALVLMLPAVYVATRVVPDSDYAAFLPAGASSLQRAFMTELRDGAASRIVLVELSGAAPDALVETSRKLAAALAASADFRYVNNGDAAMGLRELEVLERYRYALSDRLDDPDAFSEASLRAALHERLEALAGSGGMLEKRFLANDPTGDVRRILARIAPATLPRRVDGVWFDAAGTSALLLAETRASGSDLARQARALEALDQAFAASRAAPSIAIEYSSPGTMAVRSRALIAGDARTLSLISIAGVVAILWWAYRSPRVVVLCLLPAVFGLLAGVIAVNALFGSIHGITLAFGATLLGEAVDYPAYLLTQVRAGVHAKAANTRIGGMLRLAVLTTACGALALLWSGLPGLAQLGVLTIVGVLVAGAATWWWLPHVVPEGWTFPEPRPWRVSIQSRWRIAGLPVAVRWTAAAFLAMCAIALAWPHPWWDDDLASMSPLPQSYKARDARLRGALGAPDVRFALVIEGPSIESVLTSSESLRAILQRSVRSGFIAGFDLVSDYLPSETTQLRRRRALPETDVLRARLTAAAAGLPFRVHAFEPFIEGVARARQDPPLTARAFEASAIRLKVEGLLRRNGEAFAVVVPLAGVRDVAALARELPSGVRLLDMRGEASTMMATYRQQAVTSSSIGVALILVVLALGLRSLRAAVRVLAPVLLAVVVAAALLINVGQRLTVFHYVALLLTTGIGVNYALLMASPVAAQDRARMWRTLVIVSATALLAFGFLAIAHAPVLHAIGVTVCVGVVTTLLFGALLVDARPSEGPR